MTGKPKADRKAKGAKPKAARKPRTKATGQPRAEKRDSKGKFTEGNAGGPGRPTTYTDEIADKLEVRLSAGETLISICMDEDMPGESTVRQWALKPEHPFYARYSRARELGYHRMADEIAQIADDGRNDWMERHGKDDLGWQSNGEHQARSRLRVEARKWLLSKALPKIYGDKLAITDPDGGVLQVRMVA